MMTIRRLITGMTENMRRRGGPFRLYGRFMNRPYATIISGARTGGFETLPYAALLLFLAFPSVSHAATQNAADQRYTNGADGFTLGGGTTPRALTLTGGDVTLTGSGSGYTYTYPGASTTLVGTDTSQTLTNKTWNGVTIGVPYGGTGAITLSGILLGNGTSAFTGATTSAAIATALSDETGSGALVFGTGPVFSGNVGIGSATPGAALDVAGTVNATALVAGTLDTTGVISSGNNITIGGSMLYFRGAGGGVLEGGSGASTGLTLQSTYGNGTDDYIDFRVGNNGNRQAMTIVNSGNVGIGIAAPTAKLAVDGSLYVLDGNVGIGTTAPAYPFQVGLPGASFHVDQYGTATAGAYSSYSSAVGAGGLTVTGNVGIGTSAPAQALDVNGALRLAGSGNSFFAGSVGIGVASPTSALDVDGTATVTGFKMAAGAGASKVLTSDGSGNGTWAAASGGSQWTTASNDIYNANSGNVGIGTSTPNQALQVNGNVSVNGYITSSNPEVDFNKELVLYSPAQISAYSPQDLSLATDANPYFGVVRMTIQHTSGNVGIGTSAPRAKLEVDGSVYVTTNVGIGTSAPASLLTVSRPAIGMTQSAAYGLSLENLTAATSGTALQDSPPIRFRGNTWAANDSASRSSEWRMYDRPVNSGVGLTQFVLDYSINGAAFTDGIVFDSWYHLLTLPSDGKLGFAGDLVTVGRTGNQLALNGYDGIAFQYQGATKMTMDASGNLGIGTTVPVAKLEVAGKVKITTADTDGDELVLNTTSNIFGILFQSSGSNKWQLYKDSSDHIGLWDYAKSARIWDFTPNGSMAFTMGGNVGIGTTVPLAKLEVNNNLSFSSMVDNGNSGTSKAIDWNNGNYQKVTMTGNCTFTFTNPGGVGRVALKMVQDGTGGRTAAWPGTVKWPGGSPPTLTVTATTGTDFVSCIFDGTNYYCVDSLDFH